MVTMRLRVVCAVALAALLLSACGGGGKSKSSSSTTTSASTKANKSSSKKKAGTAKPTALSELITVAKSGSPASASASATSGDSVQFLTRVPGKAATGKHVKVHLDFTQNPPTKWTVTASTKSQKATATLN